MRKYVIGVLIGFCLSLGVGAHAEVVTMINKLVEGTFPVTVQGSKLPVDAVVIEGSTYLPIRAFGEAIGYVVGFDADLGVSLTKSVTDATYTDVSARDALIAKIQDLSKQRDALQKTITDLAPIVRPYETITCVKDVGCGTKEKDDLYYSTKKTREDAAIQRDAIIQQIKELVNQ